MTRITLDQLAAFLAVVRMGGVGRAAQALNLTQPAVTARIRNLEATVGAALFDRTQGALRLTKRGEILVDYAERFEHLAGLMQRDVAAPEGIEGRLRLGVSETIAECWLSDWIGALHARFPRLGIEFNVDISTNLRTALMDRAIDVAVLLGPVSDFAVANVELPGFALAWYVSARAAPQADPRAHLRRPVLTYARQTRPWRELKERLFEEIGPDAAMFPSSSLATCFRLVEADLGVAALPRAIGQAHVARGTIREFDPGWVPRPLSFTVSYLAEPKSPVIETAAAEALAVAVAFHGRSDGQT